MHDEAAISAGKHLGLIRLQTRQVYLPVLWISRVLNPFLGRLASEGLLHDSAAHLADSCFTPVGGRLGRWDCAALCSSTVHDQAAGSAGGGLHITGL